METHHWEVPSKTLGLEGQKLVFWMASNTDYIGVRKFPYLLSFSFCCPCRYRLLVRKAQKKFLWVGLEDNMKINWVSWSKITKAKEGEGLGVGLIRDLNIALICKWWWRLKIEKNSLWNKVVTCIHNLDLSSAYELSNNSITGVWSNIAIIKVELVKRDISICTIIKKNC